MTDYAYYADLKNPQEKTPDEWQTAFCHVFGTNQINEFKLAEALHKLDEYKFRTAQAEYGVR